MASTVPSRADDEGLLHLLDLRDEHGMTFSEISERTGRTRSSIAGAFKRFRDGDTKFVQKCADRGLPYCACQKPENRDGGMPVRWWRRLGVQR
ncbi:hypothetical protein [Salipiger bermudensis]|uniref:hypothetical protein n=1 Tax=Salipiger bermudensis TaxID=344736 RepID=UPI001A90B339|nr:hypothetical protein [Salipiger bermudensis]MBN9674624.1 hypothetical protein [Salipiger bermudensis]